MAKFCHEFSLNKNRVVCHLFFHGLKLTTSYFRSKLIKLLPRSLLFSPEKCVVACGIFKTFLYFLDETWKFQLFVKIFSSIFYLYWNTAHILIFFRSCYTIFDFINLNLIILLNLFSKDSYKNWIFYYFVWHYNTIYYFILLKEIFCIIIL